MKPILFNTEMVRALSEIQKWHDGRVSRQGVYVECCVFDGSEK